MAAAPRVICAAAALTERGNGVRFDVQYQGERRAAFAVRYEGKVYAYLNRCAHAAMELDAIQGEFLDYSKLYLLCMAHGARYDPRTGYCVLGPCRGQRLVPLSVAESEGQVLLIAESEIDHGGIGPGRHRR